MKLVMGNEAVALGALKAGMDFFAAYPITPASEIMHFLAEKEQEIEFVHAEDEIASLHMAIGASLAGKKAMTSTSGPGMSLMQEGIGLAHMMESPLVIVNVQRVGPSTGMPTLPAQGDIQQARWGSHGDYNPLVFYPASVSDCYRTIRLAFNAAEESRSPVIFLMDGFLAHLSETVDLSSIRIKKRPRTRKPLGEGTRHFTGLLSDKGIPQTKDTAFYRRWFAANQEKTRRVAARHAYYSYLENSRSDTLLIAYGITSRVILPLRKDFAVFQPIRIFPVLEEELMRAAAAYRRIIVIEMNSGQYKAEVERVLKKEVLGISILGGTIRLKEVMERIHAL